jgi:hypothetical protein
MNFIKIENKEKNLYSIVNNINNEYIINYLGNQKFIVSTTSEKIIFQVDSLESLDKSSSDTILIQKFIYDLGVQIFYLKDKHLGIKYFSLSDIVIINNNNFLFINPNKLFTLLDNKDVKLSDVKPFEYGIIKSDTIDTTSLFLSPELKNHKSDYIYYTCAFYSFAQILLYVFDLELDKLYYTSIYFFLKRCLENDPKLRYFIYL